MPALDRGCKAMINWIIHTSLEGKCINGVMYAEMEFYTLFINMWWTTVVITTHVPSKGKRYSAKPDKNPSALSQEASLFYQQIFPSEGHKFVLVILIILIVFKLTALDISVLRKITLKSISQFKICLCNLEPRMEFIMFQLPACWTMSINCFLRILQTKHIKISFLLSTTLTPSLWKADINFVVLWSEL